MRSIVFKEKITEQHDKTHKTKENTYTTKNNTLHNIYTGCDDFVF